MGNDNLLVGFALIGFLALGMVVPLVIDNTMGHSYSFEQVGVLLEDTIFSELSTTGFSSAMLPGGDIIIENDSVLMPIDYTEYQVISLNDAESAGINFLQSIGYIENMTFILDESMSQLNNHTHLWELRFSNSDLYVYVTVNSLTGSVIEFHPLWRGEDVSPYKKDLSTVVILSPEEIEHVALEFLETYDYKLAAQAHYMGIQQEASIRFLSNNVYSLVFIHVLNNTLISENTVIMSFDVENGDVMSFFYDWTYVPNIPVEDVLSASYVESVVREYMIARSSEEPHIFRSTLVFEMQEVRGYQLYWIIIVDHPSQTEYYLDAKTGVICRQYRNIWHFGDKIESQMSHIFEEALSLILSLLPHSIIFAIVGFYSVRRAVRARAHSQSN